MVPNMWFHLYFLPRGDSEGRVTNFGPMKFHEIPFTVSMLKPPVFHLLMATITGVWD